MHAHDWNTKENKHHHQWQSQCRSRVHPFRVQLPRPSHDSSNWVQDRDLSIHFKVLNPQLSFFFLLNISSQFHFLNKFTEIFIYDLPVSRWSRPESSSHDWKPRDWVQDQVIDIGVHADMIWAAGNKIYSFSKCWWVFFCFLFFVCLFVFVFCLIIPIVFSATGTSSKNSNATTTNNISESTLSNHQLCQHVGSNEIVSMFW